MSEKVEKKLSKKTLTKSWWAWQCWGQICYNYERMMGLGFCHSMSYVLEELYGDNKEEIAKGLTRELTYFNTENTWGSMIPGIVASLEEEKANGADVDDETINNLKAALMGPLAGIGDTITQSLVKVVLLGIGIDLALQGSVLGPIIFVLAFSAYALIVGHTCYFQGYKLGRGSVTKLLTGGTIKAVTEALGALGMIVLGALVAKNIGVTTPLVFNFGQLSVTVQTLFDSVMPKLIPLILFLVTYKLLKDGKKPTTVMIYIIVAAVILSLLGILA